MSVAREKYVREIVIHTSSDMAVEHLEELKSALGRFPGGCQVCLEIATPPSGVVVIETEFRVNPSPALLEEIERHLGPECWKITRIGR